MVLIRLGNFFNLKFIFLGKNFKILLKLRNEIIMSKENKSMSKAEIWIKRAEEIFIKRGLGKTKEDDSKVGQSYVYSITKIVKSNLYHELIKLAPN